MSHAELKTVGPGKWRQVLPRIYSMKFNQRFNGMFEVFDPRSCKEHFITVYCTVFIARFNMD